MFRALVEFAARVIYREEVLSYSCRKVISLADIVTRKFADDKKHVKRYFPYILYSVSFTNFSSSYDIFYANDLSTRASNEAASIGVSRSYPFIK